MTDKSKQKPHILSLKYGPREDEALKEIAAFQGEKVLPDNTNEILRRGLHSVRYLAEADEKPLLNLLFENLNLAIKLQNPERLNISQALAFTVLATLISKYGLLRSETFESIPQNIKSARNYYTQTGKFDQAMTQTIGEIATSLDNIFIKHPISEKPASAE
jgi:hypothetical protein